MNTVTLIGNVGKDPELRYTATGTAQVTFSVALNSKRKGTDGESKEHTDWFNIVQWGEAAERTSKFVGKGDLVGILGRLQNREWTDDKGTKHSRTEVFASQVEFLGRRRDAAADADAGWD